MMKYTLAVAALVTLMTGCADKAPQVPTPAEPVDPIARGKYLVTQVAMCQDCHTPRLEGGVLDEKNWLLGTPLDFAPTHPNPIFATAAPRIAGLPNGWTEGDMVEFLQSGKRPGGALCRPPMPTYRLDPADARAATAYLASLPKTPVTP